MTASGDSTNADFSAGTFSNTTLTGTTVSLAVAATSGTFTSQPFDLLKSCVTYNGMTDFTWRTSLPFLKELPLTAESIINYPSVLTTLQNNLIGYWRLNEPTTGTVSGTKDFQDFSGNNNHATRTGGITLGASGRFLNAISSNNSGGYVDFPAVMALIGSTSSYTISLWYNISTYTNGCGGSGTYLLDRSISGGGNPLASICTANNRMNMETRCDNGSNLNDMQGGTITLNTWQHVAIQRDRTNALYRIFADGAQVATVGDGGGCAVTLDVPRLARHATGTNQGITGRADELMIWNRALTAAEILQIYKRGGNRVEFQFRLCAISDCSDNPTWKGPDGTSATFFSELYNNSVQSTGLGTVLATRPVMTFANFPSLNLNRSRFFQYRAYLSSNSTATTPDFNYTFFNY